MPRFKVTKTTTAEISYFTLVDAGSGEDAAYIAGDRNYAGAWVPAAPVDLSEAPVVDVEIADCAASHQAAAPTEPVTLTYTNWRGETAARTLIPLYVWYGSTEWHPEPQWLLRATDTEKGPRDFALKDFGAPSVLRSKDGAFSCTHEHAVSIAYMMSEAEAAIGRTPADEGHIGRYLTGFASGGFTLEKVIEFLREDL